MEDIANIADTLYATSMTNDHDRVNKEIPAPQVTAVYDSMRGFLKSTHWSKPYYSALIHNNPQLPYHLLEHVNCTYLSTPGRAPTLLALKQHAQSLAVLISLLAPAQYGGVLPPPNERLLNGDAPFAAEEAFDWLNDLNAHYHTEDMAHQKPLNALTNLIKSNSDTDGPKWHCPLETTKIEFPEKHPFQQYRPYQTHITLLMHANEILERLDHEYSAMGGILSIIPLDSENVEEQTALKQAKTTLVGQWILYTQHLVVRMHELEIAYGNALDLLANEAVVPMQHISIHGPEGRAGREIVFPQDRWILANAGEDVFTFIHQMLDRAEAHQDDRDEVFADQKVLGDAAFTNNEQLKYRGIVKVDLNTRFYRLRNSGHGPLFVLPAFGDRPNTKHTRDIENRPTVVTIPQPSSKESVNSWESRHSNVDEKLIRLTVDKSNLEAKVAQFKGSVDMRDREIERLNEIQKQYHDKISQADKDLAQEIVRLNQNIQYYQKMIQDSQTTTHALKEEIDNYRNANIHVQNGQDPLPPLVGKISELQDEVQELRAEVKKRDKQIDDLQLNNDTLRMFNNPALDLGVMGMGPGIGPTGNPDLTRLQTEINALRQERQALQQEVHTLKTSKAVKGKILNFPEGFKLDYGSTFEDANMGITACSTAFFQALVAVEKQRNDNQVELDNYKAEAERLRHENLQLRSNPKTGAPTASKIINLPEKLQYTSTFRDDNQGLIVLTTEYYDRLIAMEKAGGSVTPATAPTAAPTAAPAKSKIINIPWKLQYTSTFRDDNQGLIVLTTEWYDRLIAMDKAHGGYPAQIESLREQIKILKTPVKANLSGVYDQVKDKLAHGRVFRDTQGKVAVLTLDYLDELEKTNKSQSDLESELGIARAGNTALREKLYDAKTQLEDCQQQKDPETYIKQVADLRNKGDKQAQRVRDLEQQLQQARDEMKAYLGPASKTMYQRFLDVSSDLRDRQADLKRRTDELANAQIRQEQLQLAVTNLQGEVTSLRQRPTDAQPTANTSTSNNEARRRTDELHTANEQINILRSELEHVQRLWNDSLDDTLAKQTRCEDEKAQLQQQLDDSQRDVEIFKMKVAADPNKLQPFLIEVEAQRDAARKDRDAQREANRLLQDQLLKQKQDCQAEKVALQMKIDQLNNQR
jgi:predicted  nucleic acid-binding Zn-ribbon protein